LLKTKQYCIFLLQQSGGFFSKRAVWKALNGIVVDIKIAINKGNFLVSVNKHFVFHIQWWIIIVTFGEIE
jgi:hypothetical protein